MVRPMRDSGFKWIGKIPNDWKVSKVKRLFTIGRGRVIATTELKDCGYPVYSSQTKNNGILGYIDTYDFDCSQLTWTTDGANAGTVFIREGKHNCTNVCGTLLPKTIDNNLKYLKYALEYIAIFHKRADINGYKIMNNEMAEIEILLPSKLEQQLIASFLDSKCQEIDNVLAKTRSSIEEYKKLKQAIITKAVTKGIHKNRKMKDSGIEWIGEIPEEWPLYISRFCIDYIGDVDHYMPESIDAGVPYIMTGDLKDKISKIDFKQCKQISFDDYKKLSNKIVVEKGDIILARYATIGTTCYVDIDSEFIVSYSCVIIKPDKTKLRGYYLFYYFKSLMFIEETIRLAKSNTQSNLGIEELYSFRIPLPDLTEQQIIIDYLDLKCSELDNLIKKKEQLISELESYKKSLIYEYVTGKKEVPMV